MLMAFGSFSFISLVSIDWRCEYRKKKAGELIGDIGAIR